jgi:hypothetical protein
MTPEQQAQGEVIRRQGILADCTVCSRESTFIVVSHVTGGTVKSYAKTFDDAVKIIRTESAPTELFYYTSGALFELVAAA